MQKVILSISLAIILFLGSCQMESKSPKAKYVFLFVGDGMGLSQIYATELYLKSLDKEGNNGLLSFSNFPVQSHVTTSSANNLITDSAAAGTALAAGEKTNNGVVNRDTTLSVNLETIAEKAKKNEYKIGILSSVAIDHATPACFYAHQNSRGMYYEISLELPDSEFDYFGGGGFHAPKGKNDSMPDAYEFAKAEGYNLVKTKEAFEALKNGDEKIFAVNPQTYPKGEFYWEIDKKEGSISLAEFTKKGIEILDNPKGFFIMVEGGKIDWSCHGNDAATTINEVLAFDNAVVEAIKFYNEHPNETLILVTADHETGGLTISNKKYRYNMRLGVLQYQNISSQEFGRVVVNYKDKNPHASFDQVLQLINEYFGLGSADKGLELSDDERQYLYEAYLNEFTNEVVDNPDKNYLSDSDEPTIVDRVIYLTNSKAGLTWVSHDHSGIPVPLRAMGQGQDYFKSGIDNTDIPKIIEKLMDIE